ncbi:kelch domain-containing protein 3-like [Ctenocephalides felis]|uniref:kelch domain-containing protein 3-like n=1 Tax=Ctenocephalides felis TaxID=7515 RepID=UPI000E6E15D1|nr:kelch domain-containing protein 3-like [Ctenocephalides felis]
MYWTVHLDGGPRRVNHAAVSVGELIYSFGGYCIGSSFQETELMDVHILNSNNYRWTLLTHDSELKSNNIPFQRYGHTAVAHGQNIYVWGGRNNMQACNILYCFDTTNNQWSAPQVRGIVPGARDGHSACVINNKMYIFGGFVEHIQKFCQDVYYLDLTIMKWNYVCTTGEPPSYRDFHTSTPIGRRMYIFGGRGDRNSPYHSSQELYCNEMKYLDTDNATWYESPVAGEVPIGRRSHSAFVYNNMIYIFGGYNALEDEHFNDIYCFCPNTNVWNSVKTFGRSPCQRRRQACVLVGNKLYLFGGTSPKTTARFHTQRHLDDIDSHALINHGDLHVLDFMPSLQTLCINIVIEHRLDQRHLPPMVQWDIKAMTTQNSISRPKHSAG